MRDFTKDQFLPLVITCFLSYFSFSQTIYDNKIFRIEANLRNGSYNKSLAFCNQIIAKRKQDTKFNKLIYTDAILYKIKNLFVLKGQLESINELEILYLEELLALDPETMSYYALGLSKLAKEYAVHGFEALALEKIEKAKSIAFKNKLEPIKNDISRNEIDVLLANGYYKEAYNLFLDQSEYQQSLIKEAYSVFVPNTKDSLVGTYSPKQFVAIKRNYADFLNLSARIKQKEGDYIFADSLLTKSYQWILQNIDRKARDVSAFDNRLLLVNNYEKLNQDKFAYALTNNNKVDTKEGLKPSLDKTFKGFTYLPESEPYLSYEEYLARHFWSLGWAKISIKATADGYYAKHHSIYERRGKNRDNINIIKSEMMLVDKYMLSDDLEGAKKHIDSLFLKKRSYNNQSFLQKDHPLTRLLLLKSIEINTKLELKNELEKRILALEEIDNQVLAVSSPNYINDQLLIATVRNKLSGNFKVPLEIYNKFYVDNFDSRLHPLHKDKNLYANTYSELLAESGQFDKANEVLDKEVKALYPYQLQNSTLFANQLIYQANAFLKSGNHKEASALLQESKTDGKIYKLSLDTKDNTTLDNYFRALTRKNIAYGDLSEAKKSIDKIQLMQENDFIEFASVFISSGKAEYISDKLDKIEVQFLDKYGVESPLLLPLLSNIANIEAQKGEFSKASKKGLQSISISEKAFGKNSFQYANASFINGTVASYFGDYKNAVFEFKKAKDIYKLVFGENNLKYAKGLSEMSLARLHKHDISTDLEFDFITASNIVKNALGYTSYENATILKNKAFYYLETGKIALAERDIDQSIQILKDLGENEYKQILAENYRINAKIQQHNKDYKKSEASYKKSLSYYYDIFENKNHLDITLTRSNLAQLYYIQGDRKDSKEVLSNTTSVYLEYIGKYFSYLTEREKKEFWKKINQDFEFYKTIAFEYNNKKEVETVYNNSLITKGLLLNSTKQLRESIVNSNNESLKNDFERWSFKNSELTRAISMSNEQLNQENIDVEQLQKDIDKLEKSLSEKSSEFASQTKKQTTWQDVRDALKANEYAVEIIKYNKFNTVFTDSVVYKALIIGKDYNTPKVIDFTDGNKIDSKYLAYYRNTTKFKKSDYISYKIFYEPIYKVVGDNAKVYVSLDGAFNLINLETMRMSDSIYVMDKNQIIIVSSTKDILNRHETLSINKNKKSLIIANPMFYEVNQTGKTHSTLVADAKWRQLPGAEQEGDIVDSMFKKANWQSTLIKWDKADENIVKSIGKNEYKDISYLHISTHGFFENATEEINSLAASLDNRRNIDDPYLRSGLMFKNGGDVMKNNELLNYNITDGVLTAKEISTLNLKGVDIVVLSACETGLGDIASGEGVYGLQRAFLSAGVKMVVISLFKVDDVVTTKFMTKMDEKFLETNNPRFAMEYAKKEIQKEYPEPIYWGSFLLVD